MMAYVKNGKTCSVCCLGLASYEAVLRLQERLVQARFEGFISDALLLLQHTPVLTLGRFRGAEDILVSPEILAREGIEVFHTNRGGSITYHGPGQLVGYPILSLKEGRIGVREYVWKLEDVIIKTLLAFGLQGHRKAEYPGSVWVDEKKVCSIGIRVSHYITMHGFALNVNNDLKAFEHINPCGLNASIMTSVAKLVGRCVGFDAVTEKLLDSFSQVFGLECEWEEERWCTILNAHSG